MRIEKEVEIVDSNGDSCVVSFPAYYIVCPRCEGVGKHVDSSVEHPMGGITASEWEEAGEDFRHNYMNGLYDIQCECCKGEKVVLEIDENALSEDQKEDYKAYEKMQQEDYACRIAQEAELRMERMMGC